MEEPTSGTQEAGDQKRRRRHSSSSSNSSTGARSARSTSSEDAWAAGDWLERAAGAGPRGPAEEQRADAPAADELRGGVVEPPAESRAQHTIGLAQAEAAAHWLGLARGLVESAEEDGPRAGASTGSAGSPERQLGHTQSQLGQPPAAQSLAQAGLAHTSIGEN